MTTSTLDISLSDQPPAIIRRSDSQMLSEQTISSVEPRNQENRTPWKTLVISQDEQSPTRTQTRYRVLFVRHPEDNGRLAWPNSTHYAYAPIDEAGISWRIFSTSFSEWVEDHHQYSDLSFVPHNRNVVTSRKVTLRLSELKRRRHQLVILDDSLSLDDV